MHFGDSGPQIDRGRSRARSSSYPGSPLSARRRRAQARHAIMVHRRATAGRRIAIDFAAPVAYPRILVRIHPRSKPTHPARRTAATG
jgi:hypothetical protein